MEEPIKSPFNLINNYFTASALLIFKIRKYVYQMMLTIILINIEKPEFVDEKAKRVWTHLYLYNNINTP
jgi:hypothetical protein